MERSEAPPPLAGEPQDEIKDVLGADGLLYQTHADLIAVGTELNPSITQFEDSCFTGARHRCLRTRPRPSPSISPKTPALGRGR